MTNGSFYDVVVFLRKFMADYMACAMWDSAFRISGGRGETNWSTALPLTCSKFQLEVISYLIELSPRPLVG
jgi:hypothetical protein